MRLVGLQRWIVELLEGGVDQQHKRTASELVLERRRVSVALEMQQVARAALLRQVETIPALSQPPRLPAFGTLSQAARDGIPAGVRLAAAQLAVRMESEVWHRDLGLRPLAAHCKMRQPMLVPPL